MTETKPRPGYRTTVAIESVDPDGLKMNDVIANWYGFDQPLDNLKHNALQTGIIEAINEVARKMSVLKAKDGGVDPVQIEGFIKK